MKSKKNVKFSNKTKKKKVLTGGGLLKNITSLQFARNKKEIFNSDENLHLTSITTEKELACFMVDSTTIISFAVNLLDSIIYSAKICKMPKDIIIKNLSDKLLDDDATTLVTNGFHDDPSPEEVYNFDKSVFEKLHDKKYFKKIMGSIYKFILCKELYKCIIYNDKNLQSKLVTNIQLFFSTDKNIDWEFIKLLLDNNDNSRILIDFLTKMKLDYSLYPIFSKEKYVRGAVEDIDLINKENIEECHKTLLDNDSLSKLATGKSWYKVDDNSIFAKICNKYNRTYFSGPSGSSILTYNLIFEIIKIEKTNENILLLLCCIIGDYVPYYHSLIEILITYSTKLKERYTLNMDPVEYVKKILSLKT